MEENVVLKSMNCPNCGASLKAENATDAITCVYCGSTVVPVNESKAAAPASGTVKVEGIKSPSSALAYAEIYFEEYDKKAFSYAQSLSVAQIDMLASSMKACSADDKNTWLLCFKAVCVPFMHKVEGVADILADVVKEYKNDNLDAYSTFDAYKRISAMIVKNKESVTTRLEKTMERAEKYGASADELAALKADMEKVYAATVPLYDRIESIPAVADFITEKNNKITAALAAKGINAAAQYSNAKMLIETKQYVNALNALLPLKGYSDTDELIKKIDKYFLISGVLEIEGVLYYYENEDGEKGTFRLRPTAQGVVAGKAIVKNIKNIITNHADILYFMDGSNKLKRCNLAANTTEKVCDLTFISDAIYYYKRKVFLLTPKGAANDLVMLDLVSGTVSTLIQNVLSIIARQGNKLIYTTRPAAATDAAITTTTNVLDIDAMTFVSLGGDDVTVEAFFDKYAVYTRQAPNNYNKNLYIKSVDGSVPEMLIEKNVYRFCSVIENKLFYYIGNSRYASLVNVSIDGTGRTEWPLYISKVLFEQGGWVYFIRKAGYNSILCKCRSDSSKFTVIAADVEEFIKIKNGYLYYLDDEASLVRVRMDGSNHEKLCKGVKDVLTVEDDKVVFISSDGSYTVSDGVTESRVWVNSIYAVDFTGGGKRKLAYDVKTAKKYDDSTVYYVAKQNASSVKDELATDVEVVYKLNIDTYDTEALLNIYIQPEPEGFRVSTIFFILAVLAFILGFFGLVMGGSAATCGGVFLLGVLFLIIGIIIKAVKKT